MKYAAPVCVQRTGRQVIPQIDAEIVKKSHLWMETNFNWQKEEFPWNLH